MIIASEVLRCLEVGLSTLLQKVGTLASARAQEHTRLAYSDWAVLLADTEIFLKKIVLEVLGPVVLSQRSGIILDRQNRGRGLEEGVPEEDYHHDPDMVGAPTPAPLDVAAGLRAVLYAQSRVCCNKVKPSSCKRRMIHAKFMRIRLLPTSPPPLPTPLLPPLPPTSSSPTSPAPLLPSSSPHLTSPPPLPHSLSLPPSLPISPPHLPPLLPPPPSLIPA